MSERIFTLCDSLHVGKAFLWMQFCSALYLKIRCKVQYESHIRLRQQQNFFTDCVFATTNPTTTTRTDAVSSSINKRCILVCHCRTGRYENYIHTNTKQIEKKLLTPHSSFSPCPCQVRRVQNIIHRRDLM